MLSFAFAGLLGRSLGPEGLGTYSYIFSFFVFANLFMEAGMPLFFFRQWSKSDATFLDDIRLLVSARLFIFLPLAVLITLYSWFFEREIFTPFCLVLALYFVDIWLQIALLYSQARNRFDRIFLLTGTEKGIGLTLGMLLLLSGKSLIAVLLSFLIGKVVALFLAQRFYPLQTRVLPNKASFTHLFHQSSSLFLLGLFTTAYFRLDVILIRYFAGFDAVGLYSSSYRLFEAALFLPTLLSTSFLPVFTQLLHVKKKQNAEQLLSFSLKLLFFLALFMAISLTIYAKETLHLLYGNDFIDSGTVLVILGWTLLFIFMNNPLNNYLIASHQEKHQLRFMLLLTATNVVVNAVLIPRFGIAGAALTTLLCEALAFLFFSTQTKISILHPDFVKLIAIAVPTFLFLTLTKRWGVTFFVSIPFTFFVYSAGAVSLKVFPNVGIHDILHQVGNLLRNRRLKV